MDKKEKKLFKNWVAGWWFLLRAATVPEHRPMLRKVLRKFLAEDEREHKEFVELMETNKEDIANKKLDEAAYDVDGTKNEGKRKASVDYDVADELQDIEDGVVTHRCHYCGGMYHISDLSGAKMGLICYKCRIEMENRD